MRTLLIVVSLLFVITSTLADIPTLFSLCSRQNHSKWVPHKPHQFNFVKAWIRSLHLNNNRCPSKGFKVLTHYYENEEEYAVDLITHIDDITGNLLFPLTKKCQMAMHSVEISWFSITQILCKINFLVILQVQNLPF